MKCNSISYCCSDSLSMISGRRRRPALINSVLPVSCSYRCKRLSLVCYPSAGRRIKWFDGAVDSSSSHLIQNCFCRSHRMDDTSGTATDLIAVLCSALTFYCKHLGTDHSSCLPPKQELTGSDSCTIHNILDLTRLHKLCKMRGNVYRFNFAHPKYTSRCRTRRMHQVNFL